MLAQNTPTCAQNTPTCAQNASTIMRKLGVNRYITLPVIDFDVKLIRYAIKGEKALSTRGADIWDYIYYGNLNVLSVSDDLKKSDYELALVRAVEAGQLNVVKWLCSKTTPTFSAYEKSLDYFEILKWLHSAHPIPEIMKIDLMSTAGMHGNVEMIQWLVSIGCPIPDLTFTNAVANGHIDLMDWLFHNNCPHELSTLCIIAVNYSQLGSLKWLQLHGAVLPEMITTYAAAAGNIEILDWLYDMHCEFTLMSYGAAITREHLHVMKWLYDRGVPLHINIMLMAMDKSTSILRWLISVNCPWSAGVSLIAANFNLKALKILIENGCPYNNRIFDEVVPVETYQWVHANLTPH